MAKLEALKSSDLTLELNRYSIKLPDGSIKDGSLLSETQCLDALQSLNNHDFRVEIIHPRVTSFNDFLARLRARISQLEHHSTTSEQVIAAACFMGIYRSKMLPRILRSHLTELSDPSRDVALSSVHDGDKGYSIQRHTASLTLIQSDFDVTRYSEFSLRKNPIDTLIFFNSRDEDPSIRNPLIDLNRLTLLFKTWKELGHPLPRQFTLFLMRMDEREFKAWIPDSPH